VSKKATTTGMSFLGVLQIVLIILKAFGLIDWSWWLVFFPMWIDLAIIALIILIYILVIVIIAVISYFDE